VVIDSLVGQVNGRPIFADEFFEPIEDQLVAEGKGLDEREFTALATEVVGEHLRDVVLNELMLAQAESGLTQQQQVGLLYWLSEMRGEIARQFGGSAVRADEALVEQQGQTFEEYVAEMRERALIEQLLQQKIASRVIVSWRDVEREYERRYEQFNPPATVSFDRIRVRRSDETRRADVESRLAAGEPFLEVAEAAGMRDGGTWDEFTLGPGGLSDIDALSEPVCQALIGLGVGDTTAPIEVGTSTWWLHVGEIDRPPALTIYDVQRQLSAEIRQRRGLEEQQRYLASLFDDEVFRELEAINIRLIAIALARYRT
jgi:hypothetical protein